MICIVGVPPSKKNSRVMNWRQKKSLPSAEYTAWLESAVPQIRVGWTPRPMLTKPVKIKAQFFRDLRADLDNLMCSLGDALQEAGVIKNDGLIRIWDAELIADKSRPRIEFDITELA